MTEKARARIMTKESHMESWRSMALNHEKRKWFSKMPCVVILKLRLINGC